MGAIKNLTKALKSIAKEKEPESAKLFRELQDFYKQHPVGTPRVKREVDAIRSECDAVMEKMQKEFEQQHEETTCVYLRRELEFVRGFLTTK